MAASNFSRQGLDAPQVVVLYASGDSDPADSHATGFDTVFDRTRFLSAAHLVFSRTKGSIWRGTAANFKQRDSLVIDFRTSKSEGQANFVQPGGSIFGYGFRRRYFAES